MSANWIRRNHILLISLPLLKAPGLDQPTYSKLYYHTIQHILNHAHFLSVLQTIWYLPTIPACFYSQTIALALALLSLQATVS